MCSPTGGTCTEAGSPHCLFYLPSSDLFYFIKSYDRSISELIRSGISDDIAIVRVELGYENPQNTEIVSEGRILGRGHASMIRVMSYKTAENQLHNYITSLIDKDMIERCWN